MNMSKILGMVSLLIGLVSCNGPNEKKQSNETSTTRETPAVGYETTNPETAEEINSSTNMTDWDRAYDTTMDISPMYGDLKMSNQQINEYESSTKSYRSIWSKKVKNNVPADNQAILVKRDSNLRSVLTPAQFKKYQEMVQKSKNSNQ